MTAAILDPRTSKELTELFALLANAAGATLAALVGRDVAVTPGTTRRMDRDTLSESLEGSCAVALGDLEKAYADKAMAALIEIKDAIAMSSMLMMAPDEIIDQRRAAGVLGSEEAEAFKELGNVLFSGFGASLRECISDIDVRLREHGVIEPGGAGTELLPEDELVSHAFQMQVGEFPATVGHLIIDLATAERWNKGPVQTADAPDETAPPTIEEKPDGYPRVEDPEFEAIPEAPIRGIVASFVAQPDVFRTLRHSCRRVGLDLHRHGRSEIPNPAAHRGEIVVIEVLASEDKQFDWCRRIKDFSAETKLVLLLRHPSRHRVTQAFLSKADVILGFPCDDQQLAKKLSAILDPEPAIEE